MASMGQISDEDLVRQVQDGQIGAFEILVRRYQQRLVWFSLRIVHNGAKAEEISQDALFKIYQIIDRVDTKRKFSTFLFEIAKNFAISELRKGRREVPLTEMEATEEVFGDEESVREVVKTLPKNYRSVVELYYFSDLSYEEISQKLHAPINTVRTHLRRAKQRLKKLLKAHGN